jgi:threonine/homoserine/homoserine lactone efflux protein
LPPGAHIVLSGIQLVIAGIGVGLLVAAPIGPVNVLCIQRAVTNGFWGGLAAGIGAMLGDGLLAAIAAFSVTAISDVMIAYSGPIQLPTFGIIGASFPRPSFSPSPILAPFSACWR